MNVFRLLAVAICLLLPLTSRSEDNAASRQGGGGFSGPSSVEEQLREDVLDVQLPIVGTNLTETTLFLQELQTLFAGVAGLDSGVER